MASLTKSCIKKKKRGTALIDGGTKTKSPTLGGMFDTSIKRCKLSDFTNYISNASNLQERLCQIHILRVNVNLKFLKRMLSRSIPAYDSIIGKRKDKVVRLFYRQKPTKENVKGEPPCVLCITVQPQNFLHTANSSHILVTFQLIQRCGQFG